MYGPRDVLTNLKKLGFKTFDGFWDEGYQEDYLFDKLAGIKSVLKEISSKPLDKIVEMHRQMQPILNHNYEVFMNFTHEDLKKIYKK
jgi:hypothetical protein